MPLPHSVCVFDAYGTLLDVASAVACHQQLVGPDAARLNELWRSKQLEYSWVLSLMGQYTPFWDLTCRALDYAMARVPSVPPTARAPLLTAYRELAAFADAAPALAALRAQGVRTAVLSNGSPQMLQSAFAASGLLPLLDAVVSVDPARIFKTAPAAYQTATDALAVGKRDICFVSSNRWDVAGAKNFGFDAVWVNRSALPGEYAEQAPDREIASLAALIQ